MKANCQKSCKTCIPKKKYLTRETQRRSLEYGALQSIDGSRANEVEQVIVESLRYMDSDDVKQLSDQIRTACRNQNELCSFWALIGECEKNKAYMATNCGVACKTCHLIDMEKRCPKLKDPDPALMPGGLNKMFERILRQAPGNRTLSAEEERDLADAKMPMYTVHVHSRPDPVTEISAALDKSMPPWVITFENFITDEECDAIIQLGYKHEYKRSEDVGEPKFDGSYGSVKSERRTSENAWCSTLSGCREEEVPTRLHKRMSDVMGIPPDNSEDFQILKYEVNGFYR
jgi:prolyl 4-hydroxylase